MTLHSGAAWADSPRHTVHGILFETSGHHGRRVQIVWECDHQHGTERLAFACARRELWVRACHITVGTQ